VALFSFAGPATAAPMTLLAKSAEPWLQDAKTDGRADVFEPELPAGPGAHSNGSPTSVPSYLDPHCHEAVYEIDVPTGL
jgi:hypothetical protein